MSEKEEKALVDQTGRNSLDPKHAPVALPVGSYDLDKLSKSLDKAGKAKDRDAAIGEALKEAAAEGTVLEQVDRNAQPGYVNVDVKNDELGITERTAVFSQEEQEKVDAAAVEAAEQTVADDAATKTTATSRGQSKGE